VEPDTCFYLNNAALVHDCQERIDVDIYPYVESESSLPKKRRKALSFRAGM
jgi:hypothetical protein